MARPLNVPPRVFGEIQALARYLYREAGPAIARRFRRAVEKSLAELADMPESGPPWEVDDPDLAGIRTWTVKGFPNHQILYRALDDRIDILHVFHGSQDMEHRTRDPE